MSLVGPLVNPNGFENRFDHLLLTTRVFRHPLLNTTALLLIIAAGAYAAMHMELFH